MFRNTDQRQASQTRLLCALGSKLETGWRLQVWEHHAPSPYRATGRVDIDMLWPGPGHCLPCWGQELHCTAAAPLGSVTTIPLSWALPFFSQKAAWQRASRLSLPAQQSPCKPWSHFCEISSHSDDSKTTQVALGSWNWAVFQFLGFALHWKPLWTEGVTAPG